MSLIDVENAKQIRDPMDVLIKMEVPEEVNLTYSGYSSSSKVADAVLDERGWPMRILADLQGNGFQLDGSCQLYDPTVTPSATNGKIGVRGNIGQRLSITVTGDTNINGLSIVASGTDAVHYNGQTAALSDGQVIIPVGASSITIEFDPLTSDTRAEVSTAMAGTSIQVTNDSIISCVVSLRSDLSIDNPTLPESEINIDIYNDVDIAEVVASIPDDTPITYSAGYVGDMSQERNFYVSGQVTWANNILSIHAVDAIHFLDKEIGGRTSSKWGTSYDATPSFITAMIGYEIFNAGVAFSSAIRGYYQGKTQTPVWQDYAEQVTTERENLRELIAFAMNVLRVKNITNDATSTKTLGTDTHNFLFTYVDAGWPMLRTDNIIPAWEINEDDCGEVQKKAEPKITRLDIAHKTERHTNYSYGGGNIMGQVTLYQKGSAFVSFDNPIVSGMTFGLKDVSNFGILPTDSNGRRNSNPKYDYVRLQRITGSGGNYNAGSQVIDENTPQNLIDDNGGILFTQVVSWNVPYSSADNWAYDITSTEKLWSFLKARGYIDSADESFNLDIFGNILDLGDEPLTFSTGVSGGTLEIEESIHGKIMISDKNSVELGEIYPQMAYESLLQRSNVTGSFTWKGDPRMQPRDVVNFHRLDGTVEEITLENITIHHEGGGTYAEITYRKGIC